MDTAIEHRTAEAFLAACEPSSLAAYEQLQGLLAALETPEARASARRLLASVERELSALPGEAAAAERYHFSFRILALGPPGRAGSTLTLLQLPSVFAPEEWSRTFYEGLTRSPAGELAGRTLAELGCGNGWIALSLGRRALPAKIYGLDINPRAIACARLNLYLNALTPEGEPILDSEGGSLLDRVEFHESDLLAWVRERGIELDRVIGCIPQVLHPDPERLKAVSAGSSDEAFIALSNYTGRQGYLEDQFGLGLVARAVEESILALRPGGRVIFNLGGRPGRAILHQLFRRRGFALREVWTTKIPQAGDTEIRSLAEIEEGGAHRFEFYLAPQSDEPVGARTALAYAAAGGAIYHSLTVFEAWPRFPEPVRHVFRAFGAGDWGPVRAALDLGYEEDGVAEEKVNFLARFADLLRERRSFPYEETPGIGRFRRHLAEFLRRYHAIPLGEESLLVLPNRRSAVRNLLTLYAPALSLLHPSLVAGAPDAFAGRVLECPVQVDLACKLIETLQPQLVVTTLDELDVRRPDPFLRLAETAGRIGARLVVDVSPWFELGSVPAGNGVFQALAAAPLPPHVAILCGLVRNRVYGDLEAAFLLSENRDLLEALTQVAEMTYSRSPLLAQEYYDCLVAELLSFRLDLGGEPGLPALRLPQSEGGPGAVGSLAAERVPPSPPSRVAFAHPAIAAGQLPLGPGTVRLDYGENALPSPKRVEVSLFEAFARRDLGAAEADPRPEVAELLRRRFGLGTGGGGRAPRIVLGLGVASLFAALAEACAAEAGTFVFPSGGYGLFVAAAELHGARWVRVPTLREDEFKLRPEALDAVLSQAHRPWLFLNGPVVNPTGSLYEAHEIEALLAVAARYRARVVVDTLFSGLEYDGVVPWGLDAALAAHAVDLVLLGGLSKEVAAGGLRFGYAACRSDEMERALARGLAAEPHRTTTFAARRILAGLNRPGPELRSELETQRRTLARRARELAQVLTDCGWEPLPPRGGLFLVARPTAYLGRELTVETAAGPKTFILDSENLGEALFWSVDLLLNNSVWTGIDEHCRLAFPVEEEVFQEGLRRLRAFRERVLGGAGTP